MRLTRRFVRPVARHAPQGAVLTVSAALVIAAVGAPADAAGRGFVGKGTASARQWTGKGACSGGPGAIRFTVVVPTSGEIALTATVTGLRNGTRWRTSFVEENDHVTQTQATSGKVVAKHALADDATLDPIADAEYQFTAFGPDKRLCSILVRPAGPAAVAAGCHQSSARSVAMTAVRRPGQTLRVRAELVPVRPGSVWSASIGQTTGGSGSASGQSVTAGPGGAVRIVTDLDTSAWDLLWASFARGDRPRCRVSLATKAVA